MRSGGKRVWLAAVAGVLAAAVAGLVFVFVPDQDAAQPSPPSPSPVAAAPETAKPAPPTGAEAVLALATGYVDNGQCVNCHQAESAAWATSQHFKAMAHASEETVLGDFNGATFTHDGVTSRFFRRDGKFFVSTDGPDGTIADFEIKYTFGVEPLQQYLIELPGGRLQAFTIAWDSNRRQWFHLFAHEQAPPGDVLHWTGRYQNWNLMCAACHSTNLVRNYDAASDSYDTTWSEINVSCQSCHGPGEAHVAWAQAAATGAHVSRAGAEHTGLDPDLRSLDAQAEVELCAPCHARRSELSAAPVAGRPLMDDYRPTLLDRGLYFADGQQQDEVYIYGSFRQSKMYEKGVRCTDCHDPHTARLKADGNAICTQCHQPDGNSRFPSLPAKTYDDPSHHFHPAGSAGAQCVNCHMPERTYMVVDPRRDHGFKSPRPDLSARLGTPNACTGCHQDQSNDWAAAAVARWYGGDVWRGPHFAEAFAAARSHAPGADEALYGIVADPAQPAIVRATAMDLLGGYGAAAIEPGRAAVTDPDPAVRMAAVAALEAVPVDERLAIVAPLLSDPVRAVRIEAARVISSVPLDRLAGWQRPAFDAALAELSAVQKIALDTPGAHLNLAVIDANFGRFDSAERRYRAALRLDPDFTPARANLAQLLSQRRRYGEAETVLRDGIGRVAGQGDLHYMLGLLLAETGRVPEAAAALGEAAALQPERARVRYNYGLALSMIGRLADAEEALLAAQRLDPSDPEIPYALVGLYLPQQRINDAAAWAEKLVELTPDDPRARQLRDRLHPSRSRGNGAGGQ